MAVFLGYIIAWIIVIGFIVAIVSGIKAAYRFRAPKELLTNGDFERYYKTVPLNGVKMPLPQTLDATEIEEELKSNNIDGIVYEEFKAFAKKRFIITREGLIYEGRVIPYEYLSFVSIYFSPTPLTCGMAQIMINGELTYLSYKFRDRERAKLAFNYINTVANPDEPWPPSLIYWEVDMDILEQKEWEDSLSSNENYDDLDNYEFDNNGEVDTTDVASIDGMDGHSFEYFCADLLKKNSFVDVSVTKGSGDQGVDILATKDGIKYAIQCKNYSIPLGNTPVQEVNAGKILYNRHVGVVMTNSTFTKGAIELAKATGTLLWDRQYIQKMME